MQIQVVTPGQGRQRMMRRPNFPIIGTMKPFGLYPIWAHPVLPGETVSKINTRFRCVSQPVKHPLAGGWFEMWYCYVKFTDIDADLGQMFISDTYSSSGFTATADSERYFVKNGNIDWIRLATERIHDRLFMDEGETARTIDGVRKIRLDNKSWMQNMIFKPADEAVGTTDTFDMNQQMNSWMMMQQMSMSELDYESYLKQFGVQSVNVGEGVPEVLWYARKFVLPKNAVEPSTGSPASAFVWYEDVVLDKDKRFNEPGFLIALTAFRPKMYQKHISRSLIGDLWGFSDFYPVYTLDDPTASVKEIQANTSDVFHADHRTDAGTKDLLYDHKDLLMHGETFINDHSPATYDVPFSAGMSANDADDIYAMRGLYADDTSIDALFSGTDKHLYYEGLASASIKGHLSDTTPT